MKISKIRKHRRRRLQTLPELLARNPLMVMGVDLPFIVVSGVSLKNAAALSIEMFFIHLITMLVGWLVASRLDVWQRSLVTAVVSTGVMLASRELVTLLIPDIANYAGIYLYLMAVNGLTLFQANFLRKDAQLKTVVRTAFINIGVFSLTIFGVSLVREYFGNGTLWGKPVPHLIRLSGMTAPFFGFILVGALLALVRFVSRKITGFSIVESVRREAVSQQSGE